MASSSSLSSPLYYTTRRAVAVPQPDFRCNFPTTNTIGRGRRRGVAVKAAKEEEEVEARRRSTKRRVVVTGVGVVSAIGDDPDLFYHRLLHGVSGITHIQSFDCSEFPTVRTFENSKRVLLYCSTCLADSFTTYVTVSVRHSGVKCGVPLALFSKIPLPTLLYILPMLYFFTSSCLGQRIGGEIKSFSAEGWVAPKLANRADKSTLYMLTAGKKALVDGGVTEDVMPELDRAKCGVLIGSALGGLKVSCDAIEASRVSYKKMNPFSVPFGSPNIGSAILAMDLGWMGPNYAISANGATSNFCILSAANHIVRGNTDMMLCGGSESTFIPIGLGGFIACQSLSKRNDDPARASRPWDMKERDGSVLGEGAGVLLLEELQHAKKRRAKIYAEILGGSFTCDAYSVTDPHPNGAGTVMCIEKALAQCGVQREDVNYINAHACSTPTGDLREYEAIIRCFGNNPELKMNSTKSMIGNLLGAAGAVEAIATIKAIQTGWIHPNLNLDNPDKGFDTNVVVGTTKERLGIKVALSNSIGFGGLNSCILLAPPP
ncbi:hypothetical protein DM860_016772 [Cuscuta australis]|uniref:beta-ketoacyl-[acyl-carrier-protein] synthase I n=1 Tax=Cuscuta australis TaxID=267555 RepID=A0A328D9T1_9ASTE|nr:hypothetical protein DM860_016772 [Cuscuta australis]